MAKKLKSLIVLALGLGLAYWFARGIDWATVGEYWRHANIWLLLVGMIFINLTMLVRAVRWQVFLKPIATVSIKDALAATVIGFGSIFVVGRAGDVVRPILLSLRTRINPSATIATIMIERVFDMSAVIILFAVNLFFISLPTSKINDLQRMRSVGLLMLAGVSFGIGLLILLRLNAPFVIGVVEKLLRWLPGKILGFVVGLLNHLTDGLAVLLNLRELCKAIGYTVIVWGLITIAYLAVVNAFGLDFSISQAIFTMGAGLVGSLVPTPGGSAGAFHVAAQKGLIFLAVEPNLAAATAIAIHIISFGSPFVFALFYLMREDIKLSQLREMMSGKESDDNFSKSQVTKPLASNSKTGVER